MGWKIAYAGKRSGSICAFCRYWYDPTNEGIRLRNARSGIWEYDDAQKCDCLQCKFKRSAWQRCGKFESKV